MSETLAILEMLSRTKQATWLVLINQPNYLFSPPLPNICVVLWPSNALQVRAWITSTEPSKPMNSTIKKDKAKSHVTHNPLSITLSCLVLLQEWKVVQLQISTNALWDCLPKIILTIKIHSGATASWCLNTNYILTCSCILNVIFFKFWFWGLGTCWQSHHLLSFLDCSLRWWWTTINLVVCWAVSSGI